MRERIVFLATVGLTACMLFSGCGSKGNDEAAVDQTIEEATTQAPDEAKSDESSKEISEVMADTPAKTSTDTPEQESEKEEAISMQGGEAVYYDGQVLFRNNSPQSFGYGALWGKFQINSTVYTPGSLCTFDPGAPEKGITTICEDRGYGTIYLTGDNTLYSQKNTEYSPKNEFTSKVYKKKVSGGEDEDITIGEIKGFSPDGKHFVVYNYTQDPYQVHYLIYEAGDKDVETAHYEPADGAIYLTIDNDSAYFLEQIEGNNHMVVQVSNNGNIYKLGECDFSVLAEYGISYPEFSDVVKIENGELKAQFDFYEGTGHFYYTSAKVSVPICTDTEKEAGDSILYEAKMEEAFQEGDPQSVYPSEIEDMMFEYPSWESGSGIANVIQYYEELDDGIFFTKAQCHRDPFEDIGWRESYCLLNYYYYFLPKGEKDPVLLHTLYEPLGKKGNLLEYGYYEVQPTIYAYAGFYADKDGKLVGAYYEEVYTGGPETPTEESNVYHMAEFADEFYYEHLKDDYSLDDFVVGNLDEFSDFIYSWIPQNKLPVRPAQYDENGNLKFEPDLTIKDGDSVWMCHLTFDKDGKIYYVRPVIMD